jgi:hypothetical protein
MGQRAGFNATPFQLHLPSPYLAPQNHVTVGLRTRRDVCGEEERPLRIHRGNRCVDALRRYPDDGSQFRPLVFRCRTTGDMCHRTGCGL